MVINEKVAKAINKQINAELYSSYLYLSMAAYCESINLLGFANWLKVQSGEENGHAMRFHKFLIDRGAKVALTEIEAPKAQWKSPLAVFEDVYAHEIKVTELINGLLKLARAEGDNASESMLKWFIDEQVEEEASSLLILQKLKTIKDSVGGLMILDKELSERK